MRILISLYIYLHYSDCKSMKKYRCIRYQKTTKNYQNDKSVSFIHTILIVLLEFSTCLARLLLEKTHQVGWFGETESIGYLTYRLAGEQKFVFDFCQQSLFQQIGSRHSILRHHAMVQCDAANLRMWVSINSTN